MKKITLLAILLCLIISSVSMYATTWFAAPNGTDDGRSYAHPFSFSKGLKALQPGDSLLLLGGTYSLDTKQNINADKSGVSTYQRTFIGAYPDEKPVLDFRMQPYGSEVTGSNNIGINIAYGTEYLHLKGITICYAGKNGLLNYGSYCLFENLDVYGCGDSGIQMKNGGNNTILNCDSHDNFDYKLDKSGNFTLCDFGGNADGFADKQFTGPGNHYIGCRAWNNSDDGWDFFQRISSSQTVIENCICYANGPAYYDMRNHPRYETDKTWFDQFINGKDVLTRQGTAAYVTLDQYTNMGNGNGFKLGGDNTPHNALVHHCLSVANSVKGFDQNSDAGTLYLYHNTAFDNNPDYGFYNPNGCQLYIQNCISYNSHAANSLDGGIVVVNDHNSWNSGVTVSVTDFQSIDKDLILSPRYEDGSLPETAFMRLQQGSRLIDAGIDLGDPYIGNAPDLGCYESPFSREPDPIPNITNAIFYWQMSDNITPANDDVLQAQEGTIYIGSTNPEKVFGKEQAQFISSVPDNMKATGKYGLKATGNAEYLILRLNKGIFLQNDTVYLSGYNRWTVATALNKPAFMDTLQTGTSKNDYCIAYLTLPVNADSLVLRRGANTGTGVAAIMVCRKENPSTAIENPSSDQEGTHKILRNSQLFLLRGKKTYTLTGIEVIVP